MYAKLAALVAAHGHLPISLPCVDGFRLPSIFFFVDCHVDSQLAIFEYLLAFEVDSRGRSLSVVSACETNPFINVIHRRGSVVGRREEVEDAREYLEAADGDDFRSYAIRPTPAHLFTLLFNVAEERTRAEDTGQTFRQTISDIGSPHPMTMHTCLPNVRQFPLVYTVVEPVEGGVEDIASNDGDLVAGGGGHLEIRRAVGDGDSGAGRETSKEALEVDSDGERVLACWRARREDGDIGAVAEVGYGTFVECTQYSRLEECAMMAASQQKEQDLQVLGAEYPWQCCIRFPISASSKFAEAKASEDLWTSILQIARNLETVIVNHTPGNQEEKSQNLKEDDSLRRWYPKTDKLEGNPECNLLLLL
ncbi:hypothetical protein EDD18DRAFT_1115580 [Armillaria luteobubalina]|uniref:Uncharacterized protein n=1 Tax=Armillaria luteobubalina TaxID=153913 RepID=A0AA39UF16_9AGAR|nr:hypothetical protein EDD18DRAFT_1115580 [Armillaria luteobubalina]